MNDELYAMTTPAGEIINIPLNHELSDRQILIVQQQSVASYAEQMRDAFTWLDGEARQTGGGRMLPMAITPYIMGLPYRIGAFEDLLSWFAARDGARFAPAVRCWTPGGPRARHAVAPRHDASRSSHAWTEPTGPRGLR